MINLDQYMIGSSPYDGGYSIRYDEGDYSLESVPQIVPLSSDDIQYTLQEGETLQGLAYTYYGDSGKWAIIAEANNILNPFKELKHGDIIKIPRYGK